MKISYYIYNNEAIATAVLISVITKLKQLDIALAPLFLPFLLDNRIVNHLLKDEANYTNIEQFIQTKSLYFTSFNNRFLTLLPVTVNSLMILQKSDVINITDSITINTLLKFNANELGLRFTKIEHVIPKFVAMIENYSLSDLYYIFRIQL